ncbi:phospholipase D family protein, partial [Vibrio sp. 10N.222.54.F6]
DMLGGEEQPDISLMNDIAAPHYLNYPKLPEDGKSSTELLKSVLSQMTWVNARFVYDPPVPIDSDDTNLPKATAVLLADLARKSEHEILLESAYLVFDDGQLDEWQSLSSNNVEINALTNSMASNDLV